MALTKPEKRALAVPGIVALVIIGVLGYNWYLSSQASILQEMIAKTKAELHEDRSTLESLEELDKKEMFSLQYQLNEWIPVFENFVKVKLYLTQKVHAALSAVGATEEDWVLIPSETETTLYLGTFQVNALFPSYGALLRFIGEMENNLPPLLPQQTAIQKKGIKINVSLTMYFAYRLKHETI